MTKRAILAAPLLAFAASNALATDRVATIPAFNAAGQAETVQVEIQSPEGPVWSGELTLGPQYGNAQFNQSKNEFAHSCEGELANTGRHSNMNSSMNFSIARANWQQQPNHYTVTFNRTKALHGCEGQGSDTIGFTRTVEVLPGTSASIDGREGITITITRAG